MENNIIIYKDGSYKFVDVSWEYENDPDWLTTIAIRSSTVETDVLHVIDSVKTVYTNLQLGRLDNYSILSAVIADLEALSGELKPMTKQKQKLAAPSPVEAEKTSYKSAQRILNEKLNGILVDNSNDSIIEAMEEYASLKVQQERDKTIQECIDVATEKGTVRIDLVSTLSKLKG